MYKRIFRVYTNEHLLFKLHSVACSQICIINYIQYLLKFVFEFFYKKNFVSFHKKNNLHFVTTQYISFINVTFVL